MFVLHTFSLVLGTVTFSFISDLSVAADELVVLLNKLFINGVLSWLSPRYTMAAVFSLHCVSSGVIPLDSYSTFRGVRFLHFMQVLKQVFCNTCNLFLSVLEILA